MILEVVDFAEVLKAFDSEHDLEMGSNGYARWSLEQANNDFGGRWVERELSREELMDIVLPYHGHSSSGQILVSAKGATVKETLERYGTLKNYQSTNSSCWQTLELMKKDSSPIFLSIRPIANNDYKTLGGLIDKNLFHLDGLHRLVARGLVDNYSNEYLKQNPVIAYIAGVK